MQANYWDKLADSFEKDVFQPVANDTNGVILATLATVASPKCSVADIGCGTGSLLPVLASQFKTVLATDLSNKCLGIARKRYKTLNGLVFLQHDLTEPLSEPRKVDVGVCLNVAIMPNYHARMSLLKNVTALIKPKGHLLLLVPSMESVLLTIHQLVRWNLLESRNYKQAAASASSELGFTACSIRDGVVDKGGTPTKHYLREELEILMRGLKLQVCSIDKVEYPWKSEFDRPPADMKAPYPWDWLVLSRPV